MTDLTVSEMDELCEHIANVKSEISDLEDEIEAKKESIKDITARVNEYFIETNREDPYVSPHGTLYLWTDTQVPTPKGPDLKTLFNHFVQVLGEDSAWLKLTVNNQLLKSELKQHTLAVEERGGDPILEPLPGVAAATTFKLLRYRKAKNVKSQ